MNNINSNLVITQEISYSVEKKVEEQEGNIQKHKLFFKDSDNNLIAYISYNVKDWNAYIVEITTASWYEHMSEEMKKLYEDNWYNPWKNVKWFWSIALAKTIEVIKWELPDISIITISWDFEEGKEWVKKLIFDIIKKVIEQTNLIQTSNWWSHLDLCELRL